MLFKASSSIFSLILNLKFEFIFIPWKIIVDTENEIITIEQRNWFLIGKDSNTIAFRFIRSVHINQHILGSDLTIKVFGSSVTAYFISYKNAEKIRQILINYNQGTNSEILFS
jgi:hypothetical protein